MRTHVLCAALFLLAGCSKKAEKEAEVVVPVKVAAAELGSIQRIVRVDGVLYPKDQSAITPKVSAPVKTFYVNRGDHVRKGQPVATLENRDLEAALVESKAQYEQAQAAYRSATAATLPEELQKARLDTQAAQQAFEAATKLYESRQQLFKEGALARRLVDEAQVAYVQAKTQYEAAQRHLEALQRVGNEAQMKAAAAQLEAAKGHYESAVAQLSYSEIRSPIEGVVTDRPLYAGEMASAGTPLVTVMDLARVVARANVPVSEAAGLKPGQQALITVASLEVPAKVTVVSPAVDPNSTTVQVWVEAVNPGEQLKPGAAVHVSIVAATLHGVVVIPAAALVPSGDGGTSVFVVGTDSLAHTRRVEIGVREGDRVQVLKGVAAGEEVVTVGNVGLEDGAKVKYE